MLMTKNSQNPVGESRKRALRVSIDSRLKLEFNGSKIRQVRHWTLTTLREKLIKIGAKVVRHSRKVLFQMAEVAVPRELFRAILEAIEHLRLATPATGSK
jgi:hypothetical protein